MYLSAARFLLALPVLVCVAFGQKPTEAAKATLERLRPSLLTLLVNGRPMGSAALIDTRGLFIAHRTAAPGKTVQGEDAQGAKFTLTVQSTDDSSGLVLLKATGWNAQRARPVAMAGPDAGPGARILAMLPTGTIPGEIISVERPGVMASSQRPVPLTEFKIESSAKAVGGALIFTYDGRFLGALEATLASPSAAQSDASEIGGGITMPKRHFGPAELTIAYTVSASYLQRVLTGFRSESQRALHPTIGVMIHGSLSGTGALIAQVLPDSPAEQAGLKADDIIVQMGKWLIAGPADFVQVMTQVQAGERLRIIVRRQGARREFHVTVGQAQD